MGVLGEFRVCRSKWGFGGKFSSSSPGVSGLGSRRPKFGPNLAFDLASSWPRIGPKLASNWPRIGLIFGLKFGLDLALKHWKTKCFRVLGGGQFEAEFEAKFRPI